MRLYLDSKTTQSVEHDYLNRWLAYTAIQSDTDNLHESKNLDYKYSKELISYVIHHSSS